MAESKAGNASDWVTGSLPGVVTTGAPRTVDSTKASAIRVAHVGVGRAGAEVLKAILTDPELELAALWATSPDDVGRDAGELAGLEPVGIAAVGSLDAALAGSPDVLVHCTHGVGRENEVVGDACFALERGVNVVTTSLFSMIVPAAAPAAIRRRLKDAAIIGQVGFLATGLNPGFATDLLPGALLAVSDTVEHVDIREIGYYDRHDGESVIREVMGFGQAPEAAAEFEGPLTAYSAAQVRQLARRFGMDIDDVDVTTDFAVHPSDVDTSVGPMAAGTVVARRMRCEARADGTAVINTDHVTRVARDVAPDWPDFGEGDVTYRVVVTGEPTVHCDLIFGRDAAGPPAAAVLRVADLIPRLVAAGPGVHSALDLAASNARSLAPARARVGV